MSEPLPDGYWVVLVISKKKTGDIRMMGTRPDRTRAGMECTWKISQAAKFNSRALAEMWLATKSIPKGFNAVVEWIERPRPKHPVAKQDIKTPYGTMHKVHDDQDIMPFMKGD